MSARRATTTVEIVGDREVLITRTFAAPCDLLWEAWTDQGGLTHWWGPRGFTTTVHSMDLRPGGEWRFTMHGPDGVEYPTTATFTDVREPTYLAYSMTGGDGERRVRSDVSWTFEAQGEATRVMLRMRFASAKALRDAENAHGVADGGTSSLERFAAHIVRARKEPT